MSAPISQREARRLRKRVAQLEEIERRRQESWSREWFGGTEIAGIQMEANAPATAAIRTARTLRHYVVAVPDGPVLRFYAVAQRT